MKPENRKSLETFRHCLTNRGCSENLNEVLRIVQEEWDPYYRADLWCDSCKMKLIDFAFGKMDSEFIPPHECGHPPEMVSDYGDSAFCNKCKCYIKLPGDKKDNITVDFENNFPNNIRMTEQELRRRYAELVILPVLIKYLDKKYTGKPVVITSLKDYLK